jgi:phosphoenolpyruvate carboxylase
MSEHETIPKTMSTQHPDNASIPRWCDDDVIQGEAELHEAYFAYRDIGCDEVMWDSEGKDVDTHVVRKLLSMYPDFFQKTVIGEEVFLTYRIPNPQIEIAERKIVTETLQIIPLSCDVASVFYKKNVAPIFEVILPFTTSGRQLIWLHDYYQKAIVGVENLELNGSMKVKDWVGPITPKRVRVIPLVEDMESLLAVDRIVNEYLNAVKTNYLRVFIARSDPALNYGLFSAVMLSKVALSKLHSVEEKTGVAIHPIIGVGSMPFRGHLSPENAHKFLQEYKGVSTVTTQSAMRYDHSLEKVKESVRFLKKNLPNGEPLIIDSKDEKFLRSSIDKFTSKYQTIIEGLAPLINSIASFVPRRRARKLHIGLFGYSREVKGLVMPRAIPFAATFYSMGIPPEFIGAEALKELNEKEWKTLQHSYLNMKYDLIMAGNYVSWESINMLMSTYSKVAKKAGMSKEKLKVSLGRLMSDLSSIEEVFSVKMGPRNNDHKRHENFINNFLISYIEGDDEEARSAFIEAARLRKCLG